MIRKGPRKIELIDWIARVDICATHGASLPNMVGTGQDGTNRFDAGRLNRQV
jgi:hypothetical protein